MGSINLNVDSILPQLTQVSSVVSGKTTLPVFECILFTNENGVFCLKASDGETWISVKCDGVNSDGDIDFCVNAKNIVSALRNLSGMDVRFDVDKDKKLVLCHYGKKGRFQLPIFDGSDFVNSSFNGDGTMSIEIAAERFMNGIVSADFAVANDELRPVMNGIHFDFTENCLEVAASDGHKLAYFVDNSVKSGGTLDKAGFTLPAKPSKIILQMLGASQSVKLTFNEEHLQVDGGNWTMTTRLCVGRYPNYKSVIPQSHPFKAVTSKVEFLNVLNRLIPFGNEKSKLIKMNISENEVLLSAEDVDWSTSAQEAVECQYNGEPLQIGFKADSLTQIIKNINCDEIAIDFLNASTAAVFRPSTDLTDTKYISILMPLIIS